jgi:hypothetical protein
MFGHGKNPFATQSDREIRFGLIFGTSVYLAWLAMSFLDADLQYGFVWLIRAAISLFFACCWYGALRELKRRKQRLDT